MDLVVYKSFFNNHLSIDDNRYEINTPYHQDGKIVFSKNGFHSCTNMVDTLMYAPGTRNNLEIARVKIWGEVKKCDDEYRGCYDIYVSSDMSIINFLTKEEIVNIATSLNQYDLLRFISKYRLDENDIDLFEGKSIITDLFIDYYQRGNKNAFEENYKIKKLINHYNKKG